MVVAEHFAVPWIGLLYRNDVLEMQKMSVVKQNALLPADGAEHCLRKTMLTAVSDHCASKFKPELQTMLCHYRDRELCVKVAS